MFNSKLYTNEALSIVFPVVDVLNVLLVELILVLCHNTHLQQLVKHIACVNLRIWIID